MATLKTETSNSTQEVSIEVIKLNRDRKVFNSLFVSLRILGSLPTYTHSEENLKKPAWKFLSWYNWVTLFFAHTYVLHLVLAGISHATRTDKMLDIFINVLCVTKLGSVVVSMDHFMFGQKELRTYLEQIMQFGGPLSEQGFSSLKRFCWFSLILGWVYLVVSISICIVMGAWTDDIEYLNFYVYNLAYAAGPGSPLSKFLVFNDMFEYELFPCVDIFVIQFYLMMVHLIKLKVKEFRTTLGNHTEQIANGDIKAYNYLMKEHTVLQQLIRCVDLKYNAIVFLWYMDVVMNIMFSLPTLFVGAPFTDIINCVYFIWDMLTSMYKFLLISIVASAVNSQEDMLTTAFRGSVSSNPMSKVLTNALTAKVSSDTLYFTGIQAFKITKSMMLSFIGGIVAYTVVLVHIL